MSEPKKKDVTFIIIIIIIVAQNLNGLVSGVFEPNNCGPYHGHQKRSDEICLKLSCPEFVAIEIESNREIAASAGLMGEIGTDSHFRASTSGL